MPFQGEKEGARFIALMAPWDVERNESNIYLGGFNNKFTRVEKWIQVTNIDCTETSAYAWIEP